MGCVLESQEGAVERERIFQMARESMSKMPPIMTQFCEYHGAHHPVETPQELSSRREIAVPQEALDPIKYQARPYCPDCASYHVGACTSPGRAEKLGLEQWGQKVVNP